jgi:hypothetical protein
MCDAVTEVFRPLYPLMIIRGVEPRMELGSPLGLTYQTPGAHPFRAKILEFLGLSQGIAL